MSVYMLCQGSSYIFCAPDHHLNLLPDCRAKALQREQHNTCTALSKMNTIRAWQERPIRTPKDAQQPGRLLMLPAAMRHGACRADRAPHTDNQGDPATRAPFEDLLLRFDMR